MQPRILERGVTILEEQMRELRELPARVERVESQILQLRTEMRSEFSAVRTEMRDGFSAARSELTSEIGGLRTETHGIRDDLRTELHGIRDDLRTELHGIRDFLAEDIRIGVDESQNLAKVLHADTSQQIDGLRKDVVDRLDRLLDMRQ